MWTYSISDNATIFLRDPSLRNTSWLDFYLGANICKQCDQIEEMERIATTLNIPALFQVNQVFFRPGGQNDTLEHIM